MRHSVPPRGPKAPFKAKRSGKPPARSAPPRPKPRAVEGERLTVEIVCPGREVLRGRTPSTNVQEIATFLAQRGAIIRRITIIDDSPRAISETLTEALQRGTRLVVTVGGLGPMNDDRTIAAVADTLQLPLAINVHAKAMVEDAYRKLHRQRVASSEGLTLAREKMCSIPLGSEPIPNSVGIPPGMFARIAGGAGILSLPGTPAEMRAVLEAAMEHLKDLAPRGVLARREVETPTGDESSLRPMLDTLAREFPSLWIQSHTPGSESKDARVRVSIEAGGADKQEAESLVEDALRRLLALAAGA
jgi:nicotinamide-nucleotide amidase